MGKTLIAFQDLWHFACLVGCRFLVEYLDGIARFAFMDGPLETKRTTMQLFSALDLYLLHNRRVRAVHTSAHYRRAVRQYCEAIGKRDATIHDLSDLGLIAMERMLIVDHSITTTNERLGRVKALWRWLAQRGMVTMWPTVQRVPPPEPYRRAWTVDQVRQLLRACDESPGDICGVPASAYWHAWHRVQWDTGERTGAMRQLRWEWLTRDGLDIPGSARKGGKAAYYRLSHECLQCVAAIRLPSRDLIFPWKLHWSSFYSHYGRLLKRAGLPSDRRSKPQRMRRTHLTYWQAGGEDASQRAKHVDEATTRRHYLDETILNQIDPATVLPKL